MTARNPELERQMALTQTAVSGGRFLRTANNLKVRQPLSKAVIAAPDAEAKALLAQTMEIIAEELNVKKVEFCDDEEQLVKRSCKANFKALGSRLGGQMKFAAARIAALTGKEIGAILAGNNLSLELPDGRTEEITAADLVIQREELPGMVAASEGGVTIALTTELTPELIAEGFSRELVSKIQNLRKEKNFEVTDRINITCDIPAEWQGAVESFKEYISSEVLAASFSCGAGDTELDVNGVKVSISIARA
jgi:isoleucyl-tRNA synthetase